MTMIVIDGEEVMTEAEAAEFMKRPAIQNGLAKVEALQKIADCPFDWPAGQGLVDAINEYIETHK